MSLRSKLTSPLVWGNLLAMFIVVVLLITGAWYFLAAYTYHGESIEVPEVIGHQEGDARYQLERLGLKAQVVDSAYNKEKPAGCILEQTPAPGRKVKNGREIFLTINTERTPTMVLPDIADNSSLREAKAKLTAMGFKLGPVEYVAGDADWVYGVKSGGHNVYAGERVPADVPLVLQVGKSSSNDEFEDFDELEDMPGEAPLGTDDLFKDTEL